MSEVWRPVKGYEGMYAVSDQGRVRSESRKVKHRNGGLRNWKGKILKATCPRIRGKGRRYPAVALWQNNRQSTIRVHSLVMTAFIGPKPSGLEVLHYDDDPNNNALTNLRYGTRKENFADMARNNPYCKSGHLWTAASTYIRRDTGQRQCLTCMKIRNDKRPRKTTHKRNRKTTLPQLITE